MANVQTKSWDQWLGEQAPKIRAIATEYPIGTHFHVDNTYFFGGEEIKGNSPLFVVGYAENEDDGRMGLSLSAIDPQIDQEKAEQHSTTVEIEVARRVEKCAHSATPASVGEPMHFPS
jgi:hypothetical protein